MGLIPGPITYIEIDGHDITDHVTSVTFTGVEAAATPTPTPDWETFCDAFHCVAGEQHPQLRVIDQDGNPVRPLLGWLHNFGSS
ncbi:hypothetical protein [Streptomyces sp. SID12488]|uniref:hypothetical protein n=1 Tax=Streptomyces sp. SID12488 TaxID=2706040 RepID=UPI0013DD2247|nr:hypothetical protein [Streptomyces sp. SID12488]NEA61350.1 hypothetical protein [Streptomyces sp. SID12488]